MNKWQLLAAMQALSVYLLVRLQEGETEHNNYDSLMLATVIVSPSVSYYRLLHSCRAPQPLINTPHFV
jgi:hypothetical protein